MSSQGYMGNTRDLDKLPLSLTVTCLLLAIPIVQIILYGVYKDNENCKTKYKDATIGLTILYYIFSLGTVYFLKEALSSDMSEYNIISKKHLNIAMLLILIVIILYIIISSVNYATIDDTKSCEDTKHVKRAAIAQFVCSGLLILSLIYIFYRSKNIFNIR
jgi:hypothetical protein